MNLFINILELNQIWIVITRFRLNWHQLEFHLVQNRSNHSIYIFFSSQTELNHFTFCIESNGTIFDVLRQTDISWHNHGQFKSFLISSNNVIIYYLLNTVIFHYNILSSFHYHFWFNNKQKSNSLRVMKKEWWKNIPSMQKMSYFFHKLKCPYFPTN